MIAKPEERTSACASSSVMAPRFSRVFIPCISSSVVTPNRSASASEPGAEWTWASMSPGSSVAPLPSTISLPSGASPPTRAILPPSMTTVRTPTAFSPSKTCALVIAVSAMAGRLIS
nr:MULTISPECIES: hypothetical protein [unclassified Streptomyces]